MLFAFGVLVPGCGILGDGSADLPIETSVSFTNLSRSMYVQFDIRPHDPATSEDAYRATPLLPPGATSRQRFLEMLGDPCPGAIDLRVYLFRRVREDLPIGLDEGEQVDPVPIAAGEVLQVPACDAAVVETYTIVNWDAQPSQARVKLAQATPVETVIRELDMFPNVAAVWVVDGVDPALVGAAPAALAAIDPIEGRVLLADGTPLPNIGVLLRARFRVRLADEQAGNDPDAGFGEPIDLATTDETGAFRFDRPPGAYRVEAFSDEFLFRPPGTDVESPTDSLWIIAEPLEP